MHTYIYFSDQKHIFCLFSLLLIKNSAHSPTNQKLTYYLQQARYILPYYYYYQLGESMEQLFKILPRTFPLFCPTYRLPGHRTWLVKEIKYFYVFIFLSLDACGKPPVFESMKFKGVPKSSYSPGEKIYFECNPGYYYSLFLPLVTFCENNNSWFPLDEACFSK